MVCKEKILLIPALLFSFVLLISCSNDDEKLNALTHTSTGALLSARNIEVIFSESGHLQARVTAPLANRFSGDYPYLEFPKGFLVQIYDSLQQVETTITGDYGKRIENTRIMDAKGNVVVRNVKKQEQLNTEQLTWDEKKRIIYTHVPVKITTPGKVLFGDGMESDESFSTYTITRPKGQMSVKRDSL
jgi:LPS export ABC transporter protein LptC